jgi:hypothetical protein
MDGFQDPHAGIKNERKGLCEGSAAKETLEKSPKKHFRENAKLTCLKLISGSFRNPKFHRVYLRRYI